MHVHPVEQGQLGLALEVGHQLRMVPVDRLQVDAQEAALGAGATQLFELGAERRQLGRPLGLFLLHQLGQNVDDPQSPLDRVILSRGEDQGCRGSAFG